MNEISLFNARLFGALGIQQNGEEEIWNDQRNFMLERREF
jgi:hypothetical protein